MAPKEDATAQQKQQGGNDALSLMPVDSDSCPNGEFERDDEDNRPDRSSNYKNWKRKLVERVHQLLLTTTTPTTRAARLGGSGKPPGDDQEDMEEGEGATPSRLVAKAFLAFALLYMYRNRHRFRERWKRIVWPALLAFLPRQEAYQRATTVSLSVLRTVAIEGMVDRALVSSSGILFLERAKDGQSGSGTRVQWKRSQLPPNSATLQSDLIDLLAKGGCSDVSALPESIWSRWSTPVLAALPFVYLVFMYRILKNLHGEGNEISSTMIHNGDGGSGEGRTTFRDVAGLGPIQQEVAEIVSYLADPKTYQKMGATPPRGLLLYGPPGSGKTLLARAVAGEARCDTFVACSGSDFCEMYVGRGAARVRALFDKARSSARAEQRRRLLQNYPWWNPTSWLSSSSSLSYRSRHPPPKHQPATAIIFIDELDALAKSRSYGGFHNGNDERDQTLNQLLTEMDGFPSENQDVVVIVIGASNRADILDPAILRRLDRQIQVGYPDRQGRRDIFKVHARRIRCNMADMDWDYLASEDLTAGFVGADIRNIVNDAALLAVRDQSDKVCQHHLEKAVARAQEMKGTLQSSNNSSNNNTLRHGNPFLHSPLFGN